MKSLDRISLTKDTDKGSGWHNYTKFYSMFFDKIRYDSINLIEIGVWNAASLKMWEEYFKNGNIYGIDYEDKSQYDAGRVKTIIADQDKPVQLFDICNELPRPDIIVDDASHLSKHQISSFVTLFPLLKSNGLYIVEDCLTSYNSTFCKPNEMSFLEYSKGFIGDVNMNGKITDLCSDKQKALKKYKGNMFEETIEWVFYATGITIIKKMK